MLYEGMYLINLGTITWLVYFSGNTVTEWICKLN